jgi:hypothetical protein
MHGGITDLRNSGSDHYDILLPCSAINQGQFFDGQELLGP